MRRLARSSGARFRGAAHSLRSGFNNFGLVEPFPNGNLYFKRVVDRPVCVYVLADKLFILASELRAFSIVPAAGERFHLTSVHGFYSPGEYLDGDTCLPTAGWSEATAWESLRLADPPDLDGREHATIARIDRLLGRRLDRASGDDLDARVLACLATAGSIVEPGSKKRVALGSASPATPCPTARAAGEVAENTMAPAYNGSVDVSRRSHAAGWAARGTEPAAVSVYVNGRRVGETIGTGERPDVAAAGFARYSAWSFAFPSPLGCDDRAAFRFPDGSPLPFAHPPIRARERPRRVGLCAIARDEAPYLVEWVAYHLALGFDQIVLYDNESTDEGFALLAGAGFRRHEVLVKDWLSVNGCAQFAAYDDFFETAARSFDWVMILDIDEFLLLKTSSDVKAFLTDFHDADGVAVNWRLFGSSERTCFEPGLVLERFSRASRPDFGPNANIKSFFRPGAVARASTHSPLFHEGAVFVDQSRRTIEFPGQANVILPNINHDHAQINHYFTKSFEEFAIKRNRGKADLEHGHPEKYRPLDEFHILDRNEEEDVAIQQTLAFRKMKEFLLRREHGPAAIRNARRSAPCLG